MKSLSFDQREFFKRRQILQRRKAIRLARIEGHQRRSISWNSEGRPGQIRVLAPDTFRLTSDSTRDALLRFLNDVATGLEDGRKVVIDFDRTETLHPCGTLYFVATIDSLLKLYPARLACKRPKNDVVEQLFQHIGLLEQLGHTPRLAITAENVVNWHYAAGVDATTNAFKALLEQHEEAMGGLVTRSELYDCMSEAVTNTRKHAYPKTLSAHESRWWMFSKAEDSTLSVAICDLGIGIPKSLMQKPEMKDFLRKLFMIGTPYKHEKTLIQIATSSTRTSTGLPYRGKGLPQMLDFIKNGKVGGFRVQSGFGCYNYDAAKQKGKALSYRLPIKGTLVQWTLPLNS